MIDKIAFICSRYRSSQELLFYVRPLVNIYVMLEKKITGFEI